MNNKKETLWTKLLEGLAAIFGMFVGKYNWVAVGIVAIGVVLFYWLASKSNKPAIKPFLIAIAIFGGHFTWFLFSYFYSSNIIFDLLIITVGVLWI